jgi:hypothetical protein
MAHVWRPGLAKGQADALLQAKSLFKTGLQIGTPERFPI